MSTELIKFETISQIIAKNDPIIDEKIEKAIKACQLYQVNETDEQDLAINNILVKCNATLPVVEGLRKEYTSPLDEWKSSKMLREKDLKKEMDRLKALRNERASKKAAEDRERAQAIETAKKHDIEVARIKKEQVLAVQLGIANRISQGTEAIAKMFNNATIETLPAIAKQLDGLKPTLKEDLFRGFLAVDYDNALVPYDEFKTICEAAAKHFDYTKCDKEYQAAVMVTVNEWKAKLPARKKELEAIAKGGAESERLAKIAKDKAEYEAQERLKESEAAMIALEAKAKEEEQNAALDAEFKGQLQLQDIAPQEGVRGVISYRLSIEDKPVKVVEALSRVMLHVLADPAFKGIYKRDKAGIPKRDDRGQAEYIDAIQDWLNMLAKVKPSPEFDGVVKIADVLTVAKAR
jgi:hypothetical protein